MCWFCIINIKKESRWVNANWLKRFALSFRRLWLLIFQTISKSWNNGNTSAGSSTIPSITQNYSSIFYWPTKIQEKAAVIRLVPLTQSQKTTLQPSFGRVTSTSSGQIATEKTTKVGYQKSNSFYYSERAWSAILKIFNASCRIIKRECRPWGGKIRVLALLTLQLIMDRHTAGFDLDPALLGLP